MTAFEHVASNRDRFVRFAEKLLRDRNDAEDAVQKALANMWVKKWGDESKYAVDAYAHTCVRRACLDIIRSRKQTVPLEDDTCVHDPLGDVDRRVALSQLLDSMPDNYRLALLLCGMDGEEYVDAASVLGVTRGALAMYLRRGRLLARKNAECWEWN